MPEEAKCLKMSKSKVYELVKQEQVSSIKIGWNVEIRESDIIGQLDKKTQPDNEF